MKADDFSSQAFSTNIILFSFLSVSSFCLFQALIFAFLPVGEKWINIGEDIIL